MNFDDVAPKAGIVWGSTVRGTDAGDGWLRCSLNGLFLPKRINGMPVLLLTQASGAGQAMGLMKKLLAQKETEDGLMFTVDATRNAHGESGFTIWPDFMTVCVKDKSRPELHEMQEGEIVYAVDGFRT